jgi:hypothetical protein
MHPCTRQSEAARPRRGSGRSGEVRYDPGLGLLQTSGEFRVNRTREKQRSCLEWRIPIARSLDVFGLTDWRWPCPFPVNRAGPCVALSSCGVPLWRVAVFVNTEQPEPPFRNFDVGAGPPDKPPADNLRMQCAVPTRNPPSVFQDRPVGRSCRRGGGMTTYWHVSHRVYQLRRRRGWLG